MKNKISILLFFIGVSLSYLHTQAQCLSGDCNNGIGTFVWDSGDTYTGEYYNGARTGLGEYVWANGSFYFGHFLNGKLDGKGYYQDNNGKIQSGTFTDGVLSSSYDIDWNGSCISGDCSNGIGIYLWEDGDSYIGEWKNGIQDGYGRMDWKDGSFYYGHFSANVLDGKGYYHSAEGKIMDGYFENGVFQGTTQDEKNTTPAYSDDSQTGEAKSADDTDQNQNFLDNWLEQSKKNDELKKNYPYNEYDFCSSLQKVVADYPNDFSHIKGTVIEDDLNLDNENISTIKVTGSSDAEISGGFLGGNYTWYNLLFEGTRTDALSKYNYYAQQLKDCGINCCTMVSDTKDYNSDSYESKLTYLLTFIVGDGYSEKYKNMVIEVEFSKKIGDSNYEVVLRVKTLSTK
ncbi:MAG TPA: hypothetical protein DCQ93_09160 [Bacteroidetes bacterium]|nr:hypothetical protein [Bacteroidota bacterium]